MVANIRILYDAAPLGRDLATLNDYGGLVVYSPMAAPLMRYDKDGRLTPSPICKAYHCEQDGMVHRFSVVPGWERANGSPVTAEDYVDAIHEVLKTESQATILLRHLGNLDSVRAGRAALSTLGVYAEGSDRLTLVIETNQSDYLIPKVMASYRFSPQVSIDHPELSAGPFYLAHQMNGVFQFALNPGYPGKAASGEMTLQFKHCQAPEENYRSYLKGNADITCNTAFPYEKISDFYGRSDFVARPNQLIMGLVFVHKDQDPKKGRKLRQALNHLIDRCKIAKQLYYAVTPAGDFKSNMTTPFTISNDPLFDPEVGMAMIAEIRQRLPGKVISIACGYDDFYPNKQVIDAIVHQLAQYRINLIPVEDSFKVSLHQKYYMKLMILFPEVFDDIGVYSIFPFATPLVFESGHRDSYVRMLDSYTAADSRAERQQHLSQLEQMALVGAYIIPLVKLNDLYFKTPGIEGIRFNPFPDYAQAYTGKT